MCLFYFRSTSIFSTVTAGQILAKPVNYTIMRLIIRAWKLLTFYIIHYSEYKWLVTLVPLMLIYNVVAHMEHQISNSNKSWAGRAYLDCAREIPANGPCNS